MNDFDKDLREKLRKADAAAGYEMGREDTIREMLISTFRGRMKWLSAIGWAYIILFSALAVFAAVRFFLAGTQKDLILYATIFLVAILIICVVKLWLWMIINRNGIQREIKRLEIRIAELAEKLPGR